MCRKKWGSRLKKQAADLLTLLRILCAAALPAVARPFGPLFYLVYILAGASDMLDGLVARKLGVAGPLGEKLDSAADFLVAASLIFVLIPVLSLPLWIWLWAGSIALVRLTASGVVFARFGVFGMLHSVSNKLTGFMLFLAPLLLPLFPDTALAAFVCALSSLSGLEELAAAFLAKEWDANRKGLFFAETEKKGHD